MTIKEALLKVRTEMIHNTITSRKAGMYQQNESTILFWLFCNDNIKEAKTTLDKMLHADDWKIDGEIE